MNKNYWALLFVFCFLSLASSAYAKTTYDFVVAKDGSGNFKTVQEAINAVPDFRKKTTTIFIKNGMYKEKLVLPGSKQMVSFIGESVDSTILAYDDFAQKKNVFGEELTTAGCSSFFIFGSDFSAENITFSNTAGPVGQALAVWVQGDRSRFIHCRFLGNQDTIYTARGREYYKNCFIEGTVDFIFGAATAVFDSCTVFCKMAGYITAASTLQDQRYGYVFRNCTITGSAPANSFYLGRPWRPYAKVVYLHCQLGSQIKPEGWNNWSNSANEKTAYYAEYNNTGPGYTPQQRVAWSHQLTNEESKDYTIEKIFDDWNPLLN